MIFFWVPETKQRTLEELDYIFAVPTRTHMHYQLTKALPYFVQRWVLFNKNATLEPLYHFDTSTDDDRVEQMMENDRLREARNNKGGGEKGDESVGGGSGSDAQIEETGGEIGEK